MNTSSPYKALIFNLIFFILISVSIWMVNVIGQNSFPGNNLLPLLMRTILFAGILTLSYYLNNKFCKENKLNAGILKFKLKWMNWYMGGVILGCLLIATIWAVIYLVYPFEIIRNTYSKVNLVTDITRYSLSNSLEELLFRGFLLLASIKLFGKTGGILFVSLLFGLFHLQGTGLTSEGLSMVMTTFTMSLLFISVIYLTKSIWPAVTLHITGNLLLHSLGFDGANNGIFQIKFAATDIYGYSITLLFEIVVMAFALFIFSYSKKTSIH